MDVVCGTSEKDFEVTSDLSSSFEKNSEIPPSPSYFIYNTFTACAGWMLTGHQSSPW